VKIVFICTGNTCRSPLAAALFNKVAEQTGTGAEAVSAGIYPNEGEPASENAIAVAKEYSCDLSGHRSRLVTAQELEEADMVVCMTGEHERIIASYFPQVRQKLSTLIPWDIDDPFGKDMEAYRECAGDIYDGVRVLAGKIRGEI